MSLSISEFLNELAFEAKEAQIDYDEMIVELANVSVEGKLNDLGTLLGLIDAMEFSFESHLSGDNVTEKDFDNYVSTCQSIFKVTGVDMPASALLPESSFESADSEETKKGFKEKAKGLGNKIVEGIKTILKWIKEKALKAWEFVSNKSREGLEKIKSIGKKIEQEKSKLSLEKVKKVESKIKEIPATQYISSIVKNGQVSLKNIMDHADKLNKQLPRIEAYIKEVDKTDTPFAQTGEKIDTSEFSSNRVEASLEITISETNKIGDFVKVLTDADGKLRKIIKDVGSRTKTIEKQIAGGDDSVNYKVRTKAENLKTVLGLANSVVGNMATTITDIGRIAAITNREVSKEAKSSDE